MALNHTCIPIGITATIEGQVESTHSKINHITLKMAVLDKAWMPSSASSYASHVARGRKENGTTVAWEKRESIVMPVISPIRKARLARITFVLSCSVAPGSAMGSRQAMMLAVVPCRESLELVKRTAGPQLTATRQFSMRLVTGKESSTMRRSWEFRALNGSTKCR